MSVYSYRHHRKLYYYFRVTIGKRQFARRLNHGARFHSKEEAELAESNFVLLYKKNNKEKILIASIVNEYEKFLLTRYKSTTCKNYFLCFKNYFLEIFRYKKLSDINNDFIVSLNKYIENSTTGNQDLMYKTLRSFIAFLTTYGIFVSQNSLVKSKIARDFSIKNVRFWSLDEFKNFYSAIDDDFWRLLFSVLYYYGLRVGELRGIKKDNFTKNKLMIDSQVTNKTIFKGQKEISPKTSSSIRSFPMFSFIYDLYQKIQDLEYMKSSKYLFPSKNDPSLVIGESSINRKLTEYCNNSKVKRINLHGFRHSCASLLINSGMDALQVAAWLGHSSSTVTLSIYSHLFEVRKNDIYDTLNKLHKKIED